MGDLTVPKTTAMAFSLTPTNLDEALKYATILSKTELVPKQYQGKPDAIVVAMAWGAEIGLSGLQAVQNIAAINGRPSLWGDAALAVVMAHPAYEDHEEYIEGQGDDMKAVCIMKRKGKSDKTCEFSVRDARRAQLWGKAGPWTNYPQRMLQMRARGFSMRDQFPDVLRGINLAEEMQDIEEKDITPKASVSMPKSKSKASISEAKTEASEVVQASVAQQDQRPDEVEFDPDTGEVIPPAGTKPPEPQQQEGAVTLSENQLRVVRAQLQAAGISETKAAEQFLYDRIEQVPAAQCNAVLQWIAKNKVQS